MTRDTWDMMFALDMLALKGGPVGEVAARWADLVRTAADPDAAIKLGCFAVGVALERQLAA